MSSARATPVLAGVGQLLQRLEDPREAAEPLEMMVAALEQAGEDSAAPKLLRRADSIYVLRGAWGYGDPGREVGRRLGSAPEETVGTPYGGNFSQACVIDAAREIQAGRRRVVLVTGAENGRSMRQAQRRGVDLRETGAPGAPDRMLAEDKAIFHEAELARGMNSASDIFAIIESAIRFARGETLEAHVERIAELWTGFNAVASGNPNAWIRRLHSAREIGRASRDNPMISYPYTRLMNANARVDMAAGLVLCSLETARNEGVPEEKLVFLHAATEANDSNFLSTRADFHRSPAIRIAGARALELAGRTIAEIDHFDLYSCFPSAVEVAATELGIPEDRPLTVTGGLTFGGGPLNSYVLHAIARMAEVLREDRGSTGLVSANGGWLAKHAIGIYSTDPPADGFRYENPQKQVDALPLREAVVDWEGPVAVEAYTVAYRAGQPRIGHAACLTDDGRRTWGTIEDPAVLEAMTREEFCGRRGRLDGGGRLSVDPVSGPRRGLGR
jgi:acetyl-CoA C-acetyltransferase